MNETLLIGLTILLLVALVLLGIMLIRGRGEPLTTATGSQITSLKENLERVERALRDEIARSREESGLSARHFREEVGTSFKASSDVLTNRLTEIANVQKNQLDTFSNQLASLMQSNEQRLERMRETVESKLRSLQEDNNQKLEQMRAVVDEKLHSTLEKRLGDSFRLVSERLEEVHKGLGEMQLLAAGVGDLKKVLMNIKTRGTWGEIQLGSLLDQILSPEQYATNVATKMGSNERVEFAIRLPGRERDDGKPIWLPIDAKFPQEDYQRLVEAQEQANPVLVENAGRQMETRIRAEARAIKEKYLDPPRTTDFAIMFLPTEGLYAEVTRRVGLCEGLQREFRVTVAGPNTLAAFLNSLQLGFRTLAIERRSSEVWSLLGAVKTDFGRFCEILERTKKKLDEASNTIDGAAVRSRAIERRLKDVQQLPPRDAERLLGPVDARRDEANGDLENSPQS